MKSLVTNFGFMLILYRDVHISYGAAMVRVLCTGSTRVPSPVSAMKTVVTGDGRTKMIMMINRQHPGPSIVVYEGQEVTYLNSKVCAKSTFLIDRHLYIRQRNSGMKMTIS